MATRKRRPRDMGKAKDELIGLAMSMLEGNGSMNDLAKLQESFKNPVIEYEDIRVEYEDGESEVIRIPKPGGDI